MDEQQHHSPFGAPNSNPYAAQPGPGGQAPNPYAAPISDAAPSWETGLDDYLLASPWARLGAVMLDGVVMMLVMFPAMFLLVDFETYDPSRDVFDIYAKIGLPMLLVAVVQWYLIATSGQSIGKKVVGLKIIKTDGSDVNFVSGVILRSWIPAFIGWIPLVGSIFGLVDALFIFGSDHRTIHDHIAGTKVISA